MTGPNVSVVIPVHNAMPYLTECLDSVLGQSLGLDRMEILAVDDGSGDGSGAELDRYAARYPQLRVTHRDTASGGASAPRNQALDAARGRYVFFCDADDVLGTDALRRMVAMAEQQRTEVVVGKTVGLGGRAVSVKAFRHDPRADLRRSEVIRSGTPQKLFRRELLERGKLRFDESIWFGEDQIFVTEAYLAADGISVVGDYDCYYLRRRADGGNITARALRADERTRQTERVMEIIQERATDPVVRRRMLARYFRYLVSTALLPGMQHADPAYREQIWQACERLYRGHWALEMAAEVSAHDHLLLQCLAHDKRVLAREAAQYATDTDRADDVIEDGRVYRNFPGFRVPGGLPVEVYDVTDRLTGRARLEAAAWSGDSLLLRGHSFIDWVDTVDPASVLLLRHRATQRELSLPLAPQPREGLAEGRGHARDYSMAGWSAVLDPAAVAAVAGGVWDAFVRISFQSVIKVRRLQCPALGPGLPRPGARFLELPGEGGEPGSGPTAVVPYATKHNCFSVDIGGTLRPVRRGAALGEVQRRGGRLEFTGTAWATEIPAAELSARLVLRARPRPATERRSRTGRFIGRLTALGTGSRLPGDITLSAACAPAETGAKTLAGAIRPPEHADPVVLRAAVDLSRLGGHGWDVTVLLGQPGTATEIPGGRLVRDPGRVWRFYGK
jgi:CDP-glycerol glycerophosphotransferase